MKNTYRRIVLKSHPSGVPVPENFEIETREVPELGEGQLLVRNEYLGLAPASRIRMSEIRSKANYDEPTPIGGVIHGQSLGRVVRSRNPNFAIGDMVALTSGGWQEMSVSDGTLTQRVDEALAKSTYFLGALGVSGFTAYAGLFGVGGLKPSDTVAVTAAAGGVGAMVGQIAKASGCKVIGIAGGPKKCRFIKADLGFDAVVDYRGPDYEAALEAASKDGIDLFFDNVGGRIRSDVLGLMSNFGRIVVCGMIAEYNDLSGSTGPSWLPILTKQLTVSGFLMRKYLYLQDDFMRDVSKWICEGRIKVQEDITDGFENTPKAFIRLLNGETFGKAIVRL